MRLKVVDEKRDEALFLSFRRKKYKSDALYIDNNYFMLKEIFGGKLHFVKGMKIVPVMVLSDEEDHDRAQSRQDQGRTQRSDAGNVIYAGDVLCEAVIAYAEQLPEYIQICFFEAVKGCQDAVELLVSYAEELGRGYGCSRIVIGLTGHVNYGLGFLNSGYDSVNSFSSPGNPEYYNTYFRELGCSEIRLNSYYTDKVDQRLERYRALINKLHRSYTFENFDRRRFDYYSKVYTDLNNSCFAEHRYYYHREYEDDREMLKELFLFMGEESLIFAFKDDIPAGFILWYPDYNELASPGEAFGVKHYFKNKLSGKRIRTAKIMEWGVVDEYRGTGLPIALTELACKALTDHGCVSVESSWILDENEDSNSICRAVCDRKYKDYAVYEKEIR